MTDTETIMTGIFRKVYYYIIDENEGHIQYILYKSKYHI